MRRWLGIGVGLLCAAVLRASESIPMIVPDAEGDPQELTFTGAGGSNTSWIVFPAGYDEENPAQSWPVYVWLHGKTGSAATTLASAYVEYQEAVAAGEIDPGIFVAPDYGPATWWRDSKDGTSLARTKLGALRARIAAATRASASPLDWHIAGFSMGGFGAAAWYAEDPTQWGSLNVLGGANLDSVSGNNWGTGDAADKTAIFGDDDAYLAANSPAQMFVANAAAIIAAGRPIRSTYDTTDGAISASMVAFRAALDGALIRHAKDLITGATHSMASYCGIDDAAPFVWQQATKYDPLTDTDLKVYRDLLVTSSYTITAGAPSTVTSINNILTGVAGTEASGTAPEYEATGLNGHPCVKGNASTRKMLFTESVGPTLMSGDDARFSWLLVGGVVTQSAAHTYTCFASTTAAANQFVCLGENTTSGGRQRLTKVDDIAGSTNIASTATPATGAQIWMAVTGGDGKSASLYRGSGAPATADPSGTAMERAATTLQRQSWLCRSRGNTPTNTEFSDNRIGAEMVWNVVISDVKRARVWTWGRQRWLI